MLTNANEITSKNIFKFICINCDFKCCKSGDWSRHILTRKHKNANQMLTNANEITSKSAILHQPNIEVNKPIEVTNNHFQCDKCNKVYKHKSTLSRHYKTCKEGKEKNVDTTELILGIMKEHKELIVCQNNSILELAKNINTTNIQTVNNNTNSHNKTFNLNLFLNETCKNAMNIDDFVNSIKLQLSDLENLGQVGYVNGITKIIVKSLKSLKEENRPVHCTDQKRKVLYVKDADKWGKEDSEHKKVRKAIKKISHNNFKMMNEYKKKYPCCLNSDSKHNNRYHKLMIETLGGLGNEDYNNEDKIINNISKVILIGRNRNVDNSL